MAHGKIAYSGTGASGIVDGVEIAASVLHEGFEVEFGDAEAREAKVRLTIRASTLDLDLPDAVLDAIRAAEREHPRRLCDPEVGA